MIDPELKTQLDQINQNLFEIKKKSGPAGVWRSFFGGVMSALGYVVGIALVVMLLVWVLQKTGMLPAFEEQVRSFTELVNGAKQLLPTTTSSSNKIQAPSGAPAGGGESIITLPNGQQLKVNITQ
ncbi:MAG: hypothetical protein KGJ93_05575 [Patescibacteria group bacterium]|nr:hypothetical protein [Patescibacteria group bacterium]